jgi:hypothetical protein
MATTKKVENALGDVALVAGKKQNLTNLLFFRYLWVDQALCEPKIVLTKHCDNCGNFLNHFIESA